MCVPPERALLAVMCDACWQADLCRQYAQGGEPPIKSDDPLSLRRLSRPCIYTTVISTSLGESVCVWLCVCVWVMTVGLRCILLFYTNQDDVEGYSWLQVITSSPSLFLFISLITLSHICSPFFMSTGYVFASLTGLTVQARLTKEAVRTVYCAHYALYIDTPERL